MYIKHGESNTRLYTIWRCMKGRCYNSANTSYINYGGRGIKVCDEWKSSYTAFRSWSLANGYLDSLSIDRIDSDGDYEPSNCRWTTNHVQSCNTRRIHKTNKSGYRGVSWNSASSKWEVSITVNKQTIKIGYYTDVLEAAKAYDSYVIVNTLQHTINNVLSDGEYVAPNTDQLLISSNSSGYRGVSAPLRIAHMANPWTAAIQHEGKKIWSGYFSTALEAAQARDAYIKEHNLPHKLNFP